jgi:hypothetical protein
MMEKISFEQWKLELMILADKNSKIQGVCINDEPAREWYDSGFSPEETFRETWENDNDNEWAV